jgi:haloalkane dehalogenase
MTTEHEVKHAAGLAYREAGPPDARDVVLLVHGYPETSWMWRNVLDAAADANWRAVAPDLAGFGDSEPDPPGTWERHVEALERFRRELGIERAALVVHDWGGLIGLRWACEHPDAIRALVICDTGFFPDRKWHAFAKVLRTEGEGEKAVEQMTPENFAGLMATISPNSDERTMAEYTKHLARPESVLELYRSGDFEKIAPHKGKLGAMGVPTLLLWGSEDEFVPLKAAHRLQDEIPHAELRVFEGAGHFVFEDEPQAAASAVAAFLLGVPEPAG